MRFLGNATVHNVATGGNTAANVVSQGATEVDTLYQADKINRAFLMIGTNNSLIGNNTAVSTIIDDIKTWCIARKARGFLVTVLTVPIQAGVVNTAKIEEINAELRAQWFTFADELLDIALDPRFQDPTNTRFYDGDQVHLTTEGYEALADLLDSLYALPVQLLQEMLTRYQGQVAAEQITTSQINSEGGANTHVAMGAFGNPNRLEVIVSNKRYIQCFNNTVFINGFGADVGLTAYSDDNSTVFQILAAGSGAILMPSLPTTDPNVAHQLWNDNGTPRISAG